MLSRLHGGLRLHVVRNLAMALSGADYCSLVPLHERWSWWPEFMGVCSGVGSLNKPVGGLGQAGLDACSVLLGHHGGGEDEEEAVD